MEKKVTCHATVQMGILLEEEVVVAVEEVRVAAYQFHLTLLSRYIIFVLLERVVVNKRHSTELIFLLQCLVECACLWVCCEERARFVKD